MRLGKNLIIRKPEKKFVIPQCMYVGVPKLWNRIPNNIREIKRNQTFVKELRNHIENE